MGSELASIASATRISRRRPLLLVALVAAFFAFAASANAALQYEVTPSGTTDFGGRNVGASPVISFFLVKRTGPDPTPFTSSVTGDSDFSSHGGCPSFLPDVGDTCNIEIDFAPTSVGTHTGLFTLRQSTGETIEVTLTGEGLTPPPAIEVVDESLDFGTVAVGKSSVTKETQVLNIGADGSTLKITGLSIDNSAFQMVRGTEVPTCTSNTSITIGTHPYCTIAIRFTPTSTGPTTGKVTIINNASSPKTITLTGTGVPAGAPGGGESGEGLLVASPAGPIDFGAVVVRPSAPAKTVPVTVTNTSGAGDQVTLGEVVVRDPDGAFFLDDDQCSYETLAGGASCTFTLAFCPCEPGPDTGTATVTADDGETLTIDMHGVGLGPTPHPTPTPTPTPTPPITPVTPVAPAAKPSLTLSDVAAGWSPGIWRNGRHHQGKVTVTATVRVTYPELIGRRMAVLVSLPGWHGKQKRIKVAIDGRGLITLTMTISAPRAVLGSSALVELAPDGNLGLASRDGTGGSAVVHQRR